MAVVHANGIDIWFERHGQGEPVLFISGSGGDLRRRPNQFDSPLAERFEVIGYDQRGLGQSSCPEEAFTMAQYADDAAALLDALDLACVPVIGVSFGGMVAQELVLRHPQRVRSMVLACTSSGGEGGASYPLHELSQLPPRVRAERHLAVADVRHTPEWVAAHPEAWERRVELSLAGQPGEAARHGAEKQLAARRGHDTWSRLSEIAVPVLLAAGEFDGIAPPENMRALHEHIADSELRFYDGGHMFLVQDKRAWPDIVQWLAAH